MLIFSFIIRSWSPPSLPSSSVVREVRGLFFVERIFTNFHEFPQIVETFHELSHVNCQDLGFDAGWVPNRRTVSARSIAPTRTASMFSKETL